MKRILLALLVLAGCGDAESTREVVPSRRAGEFVATAVGDRFRIRVEPGGRFEHYGVTAQDARGRLVVHGTDRAQIDLVERTDAGVYLVSQAGERLVPVVASPIARGAVTRYSVAQGGSSGSCTLTIHAIDRVVRLAGTRIEGCLEQTRRCSMPAGGALPRPTVIEENETLCPRLGRVKHHFVATPPLPFEGVVSDERSEVVAFRVAGVPSVARSLADRLILLPSDVSAACGGAVLTSDLRASATSGTNGRIPSLVVPEDARADDVMLTFLLGDAPFGVDARAAGAGSFEAYRDHGATRIGVGTPRGFVRLRPNPACANPSRLLPLLESLLR